jgi:hypothetical protein
MTPGVRRHPGDPGDPGSTHSPGPAPRPVPASGVTSATPPPLPDLTLRRDPGPRDDGSPSGASPIGGTPGGPLPHRGPIVAGQPTRVRPGDAKKEGVEMSVRMV